MKVASACAIVFYCLAALTVRAQDLMQVTQRFDVDPGWEGVQNRIIAKDPPHVAQDFGWANGRIGGTVWQSRTPAYYALPLDRELSWEDEFSFSCKIAFPRVENERSPKAQINGGNVYLGFFNDKRQGYRPWSSVAIRINGSGSANGRVGMWLAYMSVGGGDGGGYLNVHDRRLPTDGKTHTLSFRYDPRATLPSEWRDAKLKEYLSKGAMPTAVLLERARQDEPGLTEAQLEQRLAAALAEGLIFFERINPRGRGDENVWEMVKGSFNGAVVVELDGQKVTTFLPSEHRRQGLKLTRFGIFNHQTYHQFFEFYISDVTVNGRKLDLSRDPKWEGKGNRARFVEQEFQRQDFGYSADTTFAGGQAGEIGGLFARTAWNDPNHGYYADDVGTITLDDPVSFSGRIGFPEGSADSGMFLGYFNAAAKMKPLANVDEGRIIGNVLGMFIETSRGRGVDFAALVSPPGAKHGMQQGVSFAPRDEPYRFTFDYDPSGGDGFGQIRFALDGSEPATLNLTREQREAGMSLDRFGLASRRVGGMHMIMYFDDLTYTARRSKDFRPVRHPQRQTVVPFPQGGREN